MLSREGAGREREAKEYSSRIVLSFRRHADKARPTEGQPDQLLEVSPKGREQAMAAANPDANIEQAVAFGSPRVRSQQTAGYEMAGTYEEITGDENYEALKAKLNAGLKYGTKLGQDVRLDYPEQQGSAYLKEVKQAIGDGQLFKYLVDNSDRRAAELGDEVTYTYSRQAAGVAQILEKYLKIAPQWQQLSKYQRPGQAMFYSDTLERYMGTHATVGESFLAKVIEATKGVAARNKFVAALGGKHFDVAEGFTVEIKNHSNTEPTLHIKYLRENKEQGQEPFVFDADVPLEIIHQIARA